jgi:hypothetical protein
MRWLLTLYVLFLAAPAYAQPMRGVCAPYGVIAQKLIEVDEVIIGRGITSRGEALVELHISQDGSFTVLTRQPNGVTCLQVWGQNWTAVEPMWGDPT